MNSSKTKVVRISQEVAGKQALTAAQKRFNTLTNKIDIQKKRLVEWKETLPLYRQKVELEYQPLKDELSSCKSEWVQLLDRMYDLPVFKKTDKEKMRYLIRELSEYLIAECNKDDLKPIFNRHSDEDYDTLIQESQSAKCDLMKGLAGAMFNVDLGDDIDISSPEKFQAHLYEKLREQAENQLRDESAAPVKRKKTKRQLQNEARQEEEKELASQSVREVYRKLVADLHPDREPDEQECKRKTELMQRVNIAYGKKDLLLLLELQLEIEQIDPEHLSNIADSRLKYFNKIDRKSVV